MAVRLLVEISNKWLETARAFSIERYRNHIGQSTYKPLSPDHECIGLLGEIAFSIVYALPLTWEDLNGAGDTCDFRIGNITIDVKTYRRPISILCKSHKEHAERIVLAKYVNDSAIELIGWDYYKIIKQSQPRDFGRGIINHYREAHMLKGMKELGKDIQKTKVNLWQQKSRYTVHTQN